MTRYISILRGINVGGHKIIKMNNLRLSFEQLGFSNTQSYIQSGNLIFNYHETENKELEKIISNKILSTFDHEVPVLVLKLDELKIIIENNPFFNDASKNPAFLHLTFLADVPETKHVEYLLSLQYAPDEVIYHQKVIYLYCPKGYGNTKLSNNFIESKLKTTATTRNWKTVNELLTLSNNK
jgi:uncharacterized protein (DUF1697 family)